MPAQASSSRTPPTSFLLIGIIRIGLKLAGNSYDIIPKPFLDAPPKEAQQCGRSIRI